MSSKKSAEAITEGIRITAESTYIEARSDPHQGRYFFSYTIEIVNLGPEPARLLSRHWIITNAAGATQEVKGAGVVGQQPYLATGERFSYESFCPLDTEFGTMHGTYQMMRDDGGLFDVEIPVFVLARPHAIN